MNDKDGYEAWLEEMIEQPGGVDIFIPWVSAGGGADSERNWWKSFEVDVYLLFEDVEVVIPHMKESGGGAITFITTTASVETFGGPQAYNAMKGFTARLRQAAIPRSRKTWYTCQLVSLLALSILRRRLANVKRH